MGVPNPPSAGGSEVHPNLMGTAGLWSKFQTHRLAMAVERRFDGAVVDAPKCAGRPARIEADFLPRPAAGFRVLDQWGFNRSLSFTRCTFHEGDVTLANKALLELFGQVGLGGCIQREDHEPAGFYVQRWTLIGPSAVGIRCRRRSSAESCVFSGRPGAERMPQGL